VTFAKRLSPLTWRWLLRRFQRRVDLIERGAKVVTPVIALAETVHPGTFMWGSPGELAERGADLTRQWEALRVPLLTYGNMHLSDDIRDLCEEVSGAVAHALRANAVLAMKLYAPSDGIAAFDDATQRSATAVDLSRRLMEMIRRGG
jgi:hypothetical protein